jgi:TonB-dependent receptor
MSRYYSTKGREGIEDVWATYLMGNVRLGSLSILAGVRVENTMVEATGPRNYVSAEETARRNAWVAANPGRLAQYDKAESERRNAAQYSTLETRRGEYRKVFPGVHFKYQPRALPGLVARASYSSSVGRPSFQQIIPITVSNDTSKTVSTANPELRPQFSNNFDVTLEYYFNPAGYVTVGAFLKEIDDFIFNRTKIVGSGPDNGFDGLFEGYTWTIPDNAGHGRYRGIEFGYNQQFTFLPGFWRGFSLGFNYTKTDSYGDFGGTLASSLVAKVVPNMANLNLSYRYHRVDLRLTGIWRDEYLLASSANLALLQWQLPKWQFNLKTRYMLSPRFGFFFDVENFNRSPITESYQGPKGSGKLTANQTRIVEPKFIGGITGRF